MLASTNIADSIHMASPAEALVYMTGFVIGLVGPTLVLSIGDYFTGRAKPKDK